MSLASIPSALGAEILKTKNGDNTSKTFYQKVHYVVTHITVEPLVFVYVLTHIMNNLTTQNLNLEKACRVNLQYNTSVCDAIVRRDQTGYDKFQEEEAQKLVSRMIAFKMALAGSYPVLLMLFLGSWSDRHGRRKPLIIMPVIGDLIATIGLYVCSYFFMELSVEYSVLADAVPHALGGTLACSFLGVYTYVSGLCNDKDRTLRIGAVVMSQTISITLGIFLSGIVINLLGFKGVYALSAALFSIAIIYGAVFIKETEIEKAEKKTNWLTDFFALEHIKKTFKICFKDGPGSRRSKMFALMFLSSMIMGPIHGELAVVYLYTRIKCGWDEIDYSLYNSFHSIVQIFGSAFALSFFSKYLQINDALLGVIAISCKICSCIIFALAPSGIYFYIGACVELFHGTCHIALRSLMAKIVPPHELGQSNSVFGIFEAITPLLFGPVYTTLYNSTITIFPGAFYIVTAGLYVITFYLFFWLHQAHKKDEKIELAKEKEKEKMLQAEEIAVKKKWEQSIGADISQ